MQEKSYVYKSFRQKGSIAPLHVHSVPMGTFSGLRQYLVETTNVSPNQYKVPRVLKNPVAVKYMMEKAQ